METEDGPQAGAADTTTYTYYPDNDSCLGCRGQLNTITNAAGHLTTFNDYDNNGWLIQMTDPNGVETTYGYDPRGHVTSITVNGGASGTRSTGYTYYDNGLLETATMPNGLVLTYGYDNAQRLTSISDNVGGSIVYTVDNYGNITDTDIKDAGNVIRNALDSPYSPLGRLSSLSQGPRTVGFEYDHNGNLTTETQDPNGAAPQQTVHNYDWLNRRDDSTDAAGLTDFEYDTADNLRTVLTPGGAETGYEYDGLGNLTKEISPDRGTTLYGYDSAGNMTCLSDGRMTQSTTCETSTHVTYTYDELNRRTSIDYPQTATVNPDVQFFYDTRSGSAVTQRGRLRQIVITDGGWGVERNLDYDAFGNVTFSEQKILQTGYGTFRTYTAQYQYNGSDQLMEITYPSGRVLTYTRDAGRITGISAVFHGTVTVLSDVEYYPFGPPKVITTLRTGQSFWAPISEVTS